MCDGSLVQKDERLLRCTETMILVVSITINLGRGNATTVSTEDGTECSIEISPLMLIVGVRIIGKPTEKRRKNDVKNDV